MQRQDSPPTDTLMAKAMSHPLRVQALTILNERVASPSDIAAELGMPIGRVSYHVRALLDLGCIEEVETRPVRGALEHLYRAVRRPLTYTDLRLDETGFRELDARLRKVLDEARELEQQSARRLASGASGGPEVAARLTVLAYQA